MLLRSSKILGAVAGAAMLAGTAGMAVAQAGAVQAGAVDGSITAQGNTCSWTDGVTSDVPPNTLTIDRTTINSPGGNLSCTGGVTATLNNDPAVTFDDANGTATVDRLDVTMVVSGTQCRYAADNASATRDGDTRHYTSSTTVNKVEGGILCPASVEATGDFNFR